MARQESMQARKRDTREKIELGGLVIKAGLRLEKRALLFGALIELSERLDSDEGERARLTDIGARAFLNDGRSQ